VSTFTYFGEEFTYAEEFPTFAYAEFCEVLSEDAASDSNAAMGAALRLAVASVAEKDRKRFRLLSRKNNAKADDWLVVFRDWTAAETEHPTGQLSDSSDGLSSTEAPSEPQPVALVTSLTERQDAKVVRPDLALALSRSAG
jgi:hypothetical protein